MGGSKEVKPRFLSPPDVGNLRPQFGNLLSGLISDFQGGSNPLYAPLNPLQATAMQQFSGLLTGQDLGAGPVGAAQRSLQEGIETGFNIDTSPITQQAQNFFSNELVPGILDQYGARFGIRRGGALAEPIARAGRDVSLGVSSQLLPYAESAAQRRAGFTQFGAGLPQQGFNLGEQVRGGQQDALAQLMQVLQGGVGSLSGQGGFTQPTFAPSSSTQNLSALASILGAYSAMTGGFCWIADAIYGKDSAEAWTIRLWLHQEFRRRWYGRPILWLYKKTGRWLARRRLAVWLLRPLFGRALRNAVAL